MNPLLIAAMAAAAGFALMKSRGAGNDSGITEKPAGAKKDEQFAASEPFPEARGKDVDGMVVGEILRTIGFEPDAAYQLPTREEMLSYMHGRQEEVKRIKDIDFTSDYGCILDLIFFRANIQIRDADGKVVFERKAGDSAKMWVTEAKKAGVLSFTWNGKLVDLDNYDPSCGLTVSAAELVAILQDSLDFFVKKEMELILQSGVGNAFTSILMFFVAWGETFGAFDLRNVKKDSPKARLGGYDAMLAGTQHMVDMKFNKAAEARDWLYRHYFRYAGICRISQLRAFLAANKADKRLIESALDCFGPDDYDSNPALRELKKEMEA